MKCYLMPVFGMKMGLRWKTIFGLGLLLAAALLVMGGVIYCQGRQLAINELLGTTERDIEKDTIAIEGIVRSAKEDLMVIVHMPPILGAIRARDNSGIDPLSGNKDEYYAARIENIFEVFLKNNPEYSQLCYLDEKGNEIVDANVRGGKIWFTPRREFQSKAQSLYFSETMKLKENEVYYSEVSLNREHSVIQIPHTPIFRIATPVYDEQKKVRGIVVINIFAETLFANIRTAMSKTRKYVINQDGYFLVHPDKTWEFGFDLGNEHGIREHAIMGLMPGLPEEMKASDAHAQVKYDKQMHHVDAFQKIFYDPLNREHWWVVFHETPEAVAFKNINVAGNTMLLVGFFIMVGSLLVITWVSARMLIAPILNLSKAVTKIEHGDFTARVSEDGRKDELGELALSVNRMAAIIEKNLNELTILNKITIAAASSLSIQVMANRVLDALLELQLLKFENKTAIFLADKKTRTLKLMASRGFSKEQGALDAVVSFGDCLCGEVVEIGEPIFSGKCCDNPRHLKTYLGVTPHEYIILPLKSGNTVLGVLALYLPADIKIAPGEIRICRSIADVIAVSLQNSLHFADIERLKTQHGLTLNSMGEGLYELDSEGICTFVNPTAEGMLGYDSGELTGVQLHALTHHTRSDGSVYPQEECRVCQSLKKNIMYHVEDEVFWRKDGSCFPVEYTSTPIRDANSTLIGVVVVFSDITARKEAEQMIRRSNRLLSAISQAQSRFISSVNSRELFNELLDNLLLITDSEYGFIGEIFHDADSAPYLKTHSITNIAWDEEMRKLYEEHARIGFEFRNLKSLYGTVIVTGKMLISNNPSTDPRRGEIPDGHPPINAFMGLPFYCGEEMVGMVGVANRPAGYDEELAEYLQPLIATCGNIIVAHRNETLRKEAESKIKEYTETLEVRVNERTSELKNANLELKKLFNAIEQSDESIVITDINGTIQYVNPAFTRKNGYSSEQAIGNNPRILQSGMTPMQVYDDLWETIASGRPWKGTLINKKRSGELYYEDATIAPVFDEQGKIVNFVAVKADVTDRILAEKDLRHKNDELALAKEAAEAANRAKSDFLANMSHELRTPLNAIIGFTDIMINGLTGPLTNEQDEFLHDIGSSGKHLLALINNILDLSKVEAGKMELDLGEFGVKGLIERCLVMFKEKSMKHGIHVDCIVEESLGTLIADEMKLKQVIVNLLSNAFKHTRDGGSVSVRARLVPDLEKEGRLSAVGVDVFVASACCAPHSAIEISVSDTGFGISEADILKLFQPFRQLETMFSKKIPGAGLGLNLCKKFVELHGGKIWVESEVGKGSTFFFVVPVLTGC